MAISIRNSEAVNLAREMAEEQGVTITQIVTEALKEKRRKVPVRFAQSAFVREIMEISERCSRLRVLDSRSEDEILGYDETGLFDGN